ncbi:MAG: chromate transporter [Clostridia bacterium]|nr:chromate transporter [Clostridia bacterium]
MKHKLLQLFSVFLRIGAFTFGGGYAMIPLMQRETVEKHHWISDEDILEVVAIAESTPGPIAINASTFIGYKVAGFFGALVATTATVLPSFVIILAISFLLQEFQDFQPVAYAFAGIRAGVLALLIKALCNMYKKMPKTGFAYFIAIGAFLAAAIFSVKVLLVIIACGVLGLFYGLLAERGQK